MKTNLELVQDCDRFPYLEDDPKRHELITSSYYIFYLEGQSTPCGYIPEWVVEKMPWTSNWTVDHKLKEVNLNILKSTHDELNKDIEGMLEKAKNEQIFEVLKGWRNEVYPVVRSSSEQITMDRSASPLFGIATYGVHMTAYVKEQDGIKIWVPRRAKNKQTYPSMLDNTVAGGLSAGEKPFDCLVREAAEEASYRKDLISAAIACGTVSYFYIRDARAGGETGLFQPEVQFVYDLEVGPNDIPEPFDKEVEKFSLCTVEEVKTALAEGLFKPNCAVVMLDFFIRHGILSAENEEDYVQIVSRIHRKLPFSTS